MLNKAMEHLRSAETLLKENQYRDCVSRAYYATFSAMYAYLGEPPKGRWEHPGLRGAFTKKLSEKGISIHTCRELRKRLKALYEAREDADYFSAEIDKSTALGALEVAKDVINLIKEGNLK